MRHVSFIGIVSFCLSGFFISPRCGSAQETPVSAITYPEYKQLTLTNSAIRLNIYLPDAENGYYRGTRFDWSGVISRVEYKKHTFFGEWKTSHNPSNHDDLCGPVEEFGMDSPLGYGTAGRGDPFVKIGVGILTKNTTSSYEFSGKYPMVTPGSWDVSHGTDWIEFRQAFTGPNGWAYDYTKRVELSPDEPAFRLVHNLKNTGSNPIDTDVYNHQFFIIDDDPIGPHYRLTFPFPVRATSDLKGVATTEGHDLYFLKDNTTSIWTKLEGFGSEPQHNAVTITNEATGAAIRYEGNTPLKEFRCWSVRWTCCPEPFIAINLKPNDEMGWEMKYTFIILSHAAGSHQLK
jgi:hypothetical protein